MFAAGKTNAVSGVTYVDDVFSTYLYDGNGSTQTITNGIDLAGKGGLIWIKCRGAASNNALVDTVRGANQTLFSNATVGNQDYSGSGTINNFSATGFNVGTNALTNATTGAGGIFASWTFRKAPKFFDVVTYTGNGVAGRQIAHSLGVAPGMVIVKKTDSVDSWAVWHRGLTSGNYIILNTTAAQTTTAAPFFFGNGTVTVDPTSTVFTVGNNSSTNDSGGTYVAYLFAHDAAADGLIQCGSFTTDGSGNATVTLGWEPQFLLHKTTGVTGDWYIRDVMRGFLADPTDFGNKGLYPNLSNAEATSTFAGPTATGFAVSGAAVLTAHIYLAIRRPNKPPTSGTQVFQPTVYTGTNVDNRLVNTTIAPDMVWVRQRNDTVLGGLVVGDRLRGQPYLLTGTTAAEVNDADAFDAQLVSAVEYGNAFSSMNGFWCGNDPTAKLNINTTSNNHIAEAFKRAPGVFDVVCYTGTGSNTTQAHNLGVAPELMIVKKRNQVGTEGNTSWIVRASSLGSNDTAQMELSNAFFSGGSSYWNSAQPTAAAFPLGTTTSVNYSTANFVAYLFASLPGISKVGSYTGTGTTLQVNCGFTGGARFVLIKRTDSTGDWYVWDSARGIVAGNDPYLLLNSTAAEVTSTDYVDTYSAGFEISSTAPAAINANGGSFIFLAIA